MQRWRRTTGERGGVGLAQLPCFVLTASVPLPSLSLVLPPPPLPPSSPPPLFSICLHATGSWFVKPNAPALQRASARGRLVYSTNREERMKIRT